jgi:hypothetical protein
MFSPSSESSALSGKSLVCTPVISHPVRCSQSVTSPLFVVVERQVDLVRCLGASPPDFDSKLGVRHSVPYTPLSIRYTSLRVRCDADAL